MGSKELSAREPWQQDAKDESVAQEEDILGFYSSYVERRSPKLFEFKKYRGKVSFHDDTNNGFIPDHILTCRRNNKTALFDTKIQGGTGNAHERAYKWAPCLGFANRISDQYRTGRYPVYVIYGGRMAATEKYIQEFELAWQEYPGIYFLDTEIGKDRISFIETVLQDLEQE